MFRVLVRMARIQIRSLSYRLHLAMHDAIISSAVFTPHGRAVEKIGGVATARPRNHTVIVAVPGIDPVMS